MSKRWILSVIVASLAGCESGSTAGMDAARSDASADGAPSDGGLPVDAADAGPPAPVSVMMDFTRQSGFFTAPFPSEDRRMIGNAIDIHDFPNPGNRAIVSQIIAMIQADARGFATTAEVSFDLTGAIDATQLPSAHQSVMPGSLVFLMSVDSTAPDYLHAYPVTPAFTHASGTYNAANLLTLLPVQGVPLRPSTLYAAGVLRQLNDTAGRPLLVNASMTQLLAGTAPAGMSPAAAASYQTALTALRASTIDVTQLAGLAVFQTDAPTAEFAAVIQDELSRPPPTVDSPFVFSQLFDNYCVYQTTIEMPDYQSGMPPFLDPSMGGGWVFDAQGHPIVQRNEDANFFVTIPRSPMPAAGYPAVVFVNAGAGGEDRDEPIVDRGQQAVNGGPPIVPGSGPSLYFANAGFAGVAVDGPLGGLRNPTNANEDYTIVNINNMLALRDNCREQGIDPVLVAHILDNVSVTIDPAQCPGIGQSTVHFDTSTLAIMGHSLGAWFAPFSLAYEPRFRATVLAGYGASWIENVVYKLSPLAPLEPLEIVLGDGHVTEQDPILSLLQWAGEPADPAVYARYITTEPLMGSPRAVYIVQGIVDTYIMPPISNAGVLALGIDLAGPEIDGMSPRLSQFVPLGQWLDFVGASDIPLPASNNLTSRAGTMFTGVVAQAPQDSVEDGHEVIFQTDGPKHQYQCFLQSYAAGMPDVPSSGALTAPCDM